MATKCYLCGELSVDQRVINVRGEDKVVCHDAMACEARQVAAATAARQQLAQPPRSEGQQRLLALAERWRDREGELDDAGRALACLVGERVQVVVSITSAIVQGGQVITAPIGPTGRLLAVGDDCCIVADKTGRPLLVSRKQWLNIEPQVD